MIKPFNHQVNGIYSKADNLNWKESFYFIQAADTQFGLIKREKDKNKGILNGEINWDEEKNLSIKTVQLINQMIPAPKFMVICGDMLDQFPFKIKNRLINKTMTDEPDKIRDDQYKDFLDIFNKLKIPLICLCGNHDIGDKPTINSLKKYENEFGDNYFKFYFNGVLFVCLNSQLFYDAYECEKIAEEQEKWLDELLAEEAKLFKHVIILQHHPLFINNVDEENDFYNTPIKERKKLIIKFKKANIKKVFTGHLHKNTNAYDEDLENIVTGAIGKQAGDENENGFRVVKIEESIIKHQYYTLKNCPKILSL